MLDMARLPLDVRVHILSFISAKRDLLAVYPSCKSLYYAAIPRLYRRMTIDEDVDMEILTAAMSRENVGLQHVRHLELVSRCGDYHERKPQMDRALSLLANMLPRDILLTFMIDCSTTFSQRAMQTLYQRQRFLRSTRMATALAISAIPNKAASVGSITHLHLEVRRGFGPETGYDLLRHLPALLDLEIRVDLAEYRVNTSHVNREVASADIIKKVFGHGLVVDAVPLQLRSLSLRDLDLKLAARSILQAVNCSRLHSLALQSCINITSLLSGIRPTGVPARMAMTSLALISVVNHYEEREDDAIDDFLASFGGLEYLVISADSSEGLRPSMASVAAHAETLRFLFLHSEWAEPPESHPGGCHEDPKQLRACLAQCSQLEQIALNVPLPDLDHSIEAIRKHHGDFADALAAAPSLRTFRMLTSPDEEDLDYDVLGHNGFKILITAALRDHATEYFTRIPSMNVLSVAHDVRTPGNAFYFGDQLLPPKFYARGRSIDAYGKSEAVALEVNRKSAQDIEPVSEIFDVEPQSWRMVRYGYRP